MPIILFISFALAIGLYIVQPLADPDIWWHVVSGRWIVANFAVPTRDIWTQFGGDIPWVAYSWSNEIIFALFDRYFGLEGLLFLQMLLAVSFAIIICWTLGRVAKNFLLGSLLGAAIVAGCHAHFSLRPQSLVWIFLTLTLYFSEDISRRGFTKTSVFGLIAVFCAWANSHITTAVGIGVVAAWTWPGFPWKASSLRTPLMACLLAFVATLLTPYLGYEWLVFFSKTGHPMMFSSIQEFGPATILQTPTAFLLLAAGLATSFWFLDPKALTLTQLIGAAILLLGSLAVVKFLPFALIYFGFLIARQWQSIGTEAATKPGLVQALQNLENLVAKVPKEGLSFVLICTAIVNAHNTWIFLIDRNSLPVDAIDLIQTQKLPLPILNTFGDGGYLSYRFADKAGNPGIKVAIDGRTNLISHENWDIYQKAWAGRWGWQQYLEKVNPKTILWRADSALVRILEAEGKWCTVFKMAKDTATPVLMMERETVAMLAESGSKLSCL